MRKLLYLVIALGVIWCGYWFVGASAVRRGVTAWFAEQRAAGLTAQYDDMRVWGFPNRFDLTLTRPEIADPRSGWGWGAEFFQVFALTYKPTHFVAVFPHAQDLASPAGPARIASTDMRASAVFVPGPSLTLDRTRLVIEALEVATPAATWSVASFLFSTQRAAGDDTGHRLGVQGTGLTLPAPLRQTLDPDAALPAAIDRLHLDATLGFDRPIDRHALETPPEVQSLDLRDLTATWGRLNLTVTGSLTADAAGFAVGTLTVTAQNWRQIVALAVNAGLLRPEDRAMTETALTFLAGMSGDDPDRIEVPLTFAEGRASLGPIPLGPAPSLHP